MKQSLPIVILLAAVLGGFFFVQPAATDLKIPGGSAEGNSKARRAWQRLRLADPATGAVPAHAEQMDRWFARRMPMPATERNNTDWVARGPWNLGGRTRALALDVTNENRILAGGASGGMWLSEDGGQSWTRRTAPNAHASCVSVAQDTRPGKTDTWYYASGELFGTSASGPGAFYLGDGIFKSTDGGLSWQILGAADNGDPEQFTTDWQGCYRVLTYPNDLVNNVVLVATYGGIYRSNNGGTSWTKVLNSGSYATDIAATSTGALYATASTDGGNNNGVFRSNNGIGWTKISPDPASSGFPAVIDRMVIGINPNNENEVYFLGHTEGHGFQNMFLSGSDWTSLWKYTYLSGNGTGDGGLWENLTPNLPSTGTEFDRFTAQGGYNLVVKVQPGTNHVFIGGTNLYRSTDGFASPNNTTQIGGYKPGTFLPFFEIYPNQHPDQHDLLFLPSNPNVMITASDGGLHRTEDCNAPTVDWTALNNGYRTTQCYTIIMNKAVAGDSTIITGLQDNGNFFVNSTNPTAPWRQTVNGDGSYGDMATDESFYVLSIQQGRVAKVALDEAGNITGFQRIDPVGRVKDDYLFINPLVMDPNDNDVLYLPAGRYFYRQDMLGDIPLLGEWDSIATGWLRFPDTLVSLASGTEHTFSAIAVSKANPTHRVYLGTSRNRIFRIDNAHTGTPSMLALPSPAVSNAAYVNSIAVDPENADHVVVLYSNYSVYSLFASYDGGNTWEKVAGNLESSVGGGGAGPSLRSISILPLADGSRKYFCGTSIGLYSANALVPHTNTSPGTQWVIESIDFIGRPVVEYVESRPSDGLVVIGTHANGVYSASFMASSSTGGPTAAQGIRAWPNPVRDVLHFDLAGGSGGRLRLFDSRGKIALDVALQGAQPSVQVGDLPAGTYFYQIQGKNWQHSGKVLRTAHDR
jgi:hypothetical protein